MGKKNDVQRLPAEALFQKEIDALIQAEQDPVPTGWNMSPRSVLTYICGGKAGFGQLYHFVGEVAEDGSEIWSELAADFTQVGAYAFMAFNLLCAPCFAAMGAIKREMNNGKWTALAIGYMCAYAYVVSTIIYQIGGLITGELAFGIGTVVAIAFIALIIFLLFRKPAKADSTEGLRRMSVDAN